MAHVWSCQVGALVWGSVRRIERFGLFLGLDNLRMSGLLHISNMSRAHVHDPMVRRPGSTSHPAPLRSSRVGAAGALESAQVSGLTPGGAKALWLRSCRRTSCQVCAARS